MSNIRRIIISLLAICSCIAIAQGQSTITATGGTGTGSGGSATYTVGQITYKTFSGTTGSVAHGVQQPYEISVVTAIEKTGADQSEGHYIDLNYFM